MVFIELHDLHKHVCRLIPSGVSCYKYCFCKLLVPVVGGNSDFCFHEDLLFEFHDYVVQSKFGMSQSHNNDVACQTPKTNSFSVRQSNKT